MAAAKVRQVRKVAYREAVPEAAPAGDPVVCLHGFPESSFMWRGLLEAIAGESDRRAIAPDLAGFGDTPPDPPGTWERQVELVERFRRELGLERVALVVHDWGGLIGLRWACDNPDAVSALVISNTGFFPEGRWHGMARAMRTPGQGEELIAGFEREGFGALMRSLSAGFGGEAIAEYWKAFESDAGRSGILDLYRSGDFSKLEAYEGKLAALGVPALILWGANDPFAPVAGAHRFHEELPDSELAVVEGAGHFVYADAPERCAREVTQFLDRL
jgi:haloalkane dehalogenase